MTKGEQTRQRLVAEAAGLFNRHGYEGSSMQDIMQATGLKKGGIYRHFGTKEELAQEAFDYAWRETIEARLKNLDSVTNSVDRLKQFVENFVEARAGKWMTEFRSEKTCASRAARLAQYACGHCSERLKSA